NLEDQSSLICSPQFQAHISGEELHGLENIRRLGGDDFSLFGQGDLLVDDHLSALDGGRYSCSLELAHHWSRRERCLSGFNYNISGSTCPSLDGHGLLALFQQAIELEGILIGKDQGSLIFDVVRKLSDLRS